MQTVLLSPPVQRFIREHENADEKKLVLQHREVEGAPAAWVAAQIAARRKAKDKLPSYYHAENILYPPSVNLEQSSSEQTARYKVSVVRDLFPSLTTGGTMIDLTGGFGIDSFFFSSFFREVHYVEPDLSLLEITQHNHQQLSASGIRHHNSTAENFLDHSDRSADLIYIDPSRRAKGNQKIFKLSDGEPDVVSLQDRIFKLTDYLLVKASPLLDLRQGLKELKGVMKIFVVSVNNECKELLFLMRKDFQEEPSVVAINLFKDNVDEYVFTLSAEKDLNVQYSAPLHYLYEPNASILKAGAFKMITTQFDVTKLHASTHLYTSDQYKPDFPGRIFEIGSAVKSDARSAALQFPDGKANVITRNYPLSVEELKKKLKLNDGGEKYLLAFTAGNDKLLVSASRLK